MSKQTILNLVFEPTLKLSVASPKEYRPVLEHVQFLKKDSATILIQATDSYMLTQRVITGESIYEIEEDFESILIPARMIEQLSKKPKNGKKIRLIVFDDYSFELFRDGFTMTGKYDSVGRFPNFKQLRPEPRTDENSFTVGLSVSRLKKLIDSLPNDHGCFNDSVVELNFSLDGAMKPIIVKRSKDEHEDAFNLLMPTRIP